MRSIDIKLVRGDALRISADVTLVGSRCPLLGSLERTSGAFFRRFLVGDLVDEPLCDTRVLCADESAWSNTLVLKHTSRSRVRQRAVEEIAGLLAAAHMVFRPARILILPLSCRNPESVALSTLCAIYQLHYFTETNRFTSAARADAVEYVVCDLGDVTPFERVLADEAGLLRRWFEDQLAPWAGLPFMEQLDFQRLAFSVTDLGLVGGSSGL